MQKIVKLVMALSFKELELFLSPFSGQSKGILIAYNEKEFDFFCAQEFKMQQ